jgi:hypothetical protein
MNPYIPHNNNLPPIMRVAPQIRLRLFPHAMIINMIDFLRPRHRRRPMPVLQGTSMAHRAYQAIPEWRGIQRYSLVVGKIDDVVKLDENIVSLHASHISIFVENILHVVNLDP